ncbi:nucleoside/nucleotide kinase family protein [uncultured Cohaesibacter sp.]|uniref:nucleoside/nucleotide kinase family protein n=1 Tax=uncultured Cohaesibacter sp. TaxID=1002546 RepID=UPI0029C7FF6F|nr:nucleoside/nucleotide kinase family protein [uncultured Cohaesibacter sp.]
MTIDREKEADGLLEQILAARPNGHRRLVALAGPPASGKSTLAEYLAERLRNQGHSAKVVPMDGFHLHNQILLDRGLLSRKGAPETFDVAGFVALVMRLTEKREIICPVFDRDRDIAIAGAEVVPEDCQTVILEGNYLLFDAPGWRDLKDYWSLSVRLDVPLDVLRERLIKRWLVHGLMPEQAEKRAEENDLRNAAVVNDRHLEADIVF